MKHWSALVLLLLVFFVAPALRVSGLLNPECHCHHHHHQDDDASDDDGPWLNHQHDDHETTDLGDRVAVTSERLSRFELPVTAIVMTPLVVERPVVPPRTVRPARETPPRILLPYHSADRPRLS